MEVINFQYNEAELKRWNHNVIKKIAKKYNLSDVGDKTSLINNILDYQDLLSQKKLSRKRSPQLTKNLPLEPYKDWTKVAIRDKDNLYDYWIVPKNTLLYKGVDVKFEDDILPEVPAFYANLSIASNYAFDNVVKKRFGEFGKVITVITIEDIKLLDLSSKKTLSSLQKLKQPDINIQTYFGTPVEPKRVSGYEQDAKISQWLCENNFSGFGYPKYAGFHNEAMICSNDFIRRYDIEYRSINKLQCLFEIDVNKGLIDVIPAKLEWGGEAVRSIISHGEYYPDNIRKTDKYIPDIREKAKLLCDPVISQHENLLLETKTAIINNDVEKIRKGINKGLSPSYLIHTAINNKRQVNSETIKLLIDEGANPNFLKDLVDLDKNTILFALDHGAQASLFIDKVNEIPLLELLLDNGADSTKIGIKAVDMKNYNLLRKSLSYGAQAYNILERSLDKEYYKGAELAVSYDPNLYTTGLLYKYVSKNTIKQLLFLLDHGADPNNAISNAIANEDRDIIKLLIDRGLDYSFLTSLNYNYIKPELIFFLEYSRNKIPQEDLLAFRDNLINMRKQPYIYDKSSIDKIMREVDKLLKQY
jgi:hypothetical protein